MMVTKLDVFQGHYVFDARKPTSGVSLASLISRRLVVLKIFRRFGCPLSRSEALDLSQEHDTFRRLNVTLVGIGFDGQGVTEFDLGRFWAGELYLDPTRQIYSLFNLGRMSRFTAIANMMFQESFTLLSRNSLGGDLRGDSLQLGGTFVITGDGSILYSHVQFDHTSRPDLPHILNLCSRDQPTPMYNPVRSQPHPYFLSPTPKTKPSTEPINKPLKEPLKISLKPPIVKRLNDVV